MSDKKTEEKELLTEWIGIFKKQPKALWLRILISIFTVIIYVTAVGISFVFPFLKFETNIRWYMFAVWFISFAIFWAIYIRYDILKRKHDDEYKEKYLKNKTTYIWSMITTLLIFTVAFGCLFLNNSFGTRFNILTLPILVAILMIALYAVIVTICEEKKMFFVRLGKIVIYSFLLILLATGVFIANTQELTEMQKIASMVAIVGGGIPLFVMIIMGIIKMLSAESKSRLGKTIKLFSIILIVVVVSIAITVLIDKLPLDENSKLKEYLITVLAGMGGGSLTLLGVLMEIKHQEKVRKEEKLERDNENKNQRIREITPVMGVYNVFQKGDKVKDFNYFVDSSCVISNFLFVACVKNTDKIGFLVEGIEVNNKLYQNVNNDEYIDKGTMFAIKLHSSEYFVIDSCYLLVKDIDLNKHKYKIEFNNEGNFLRAISIREVSND